MDIKPKDLPLLLLAFFGTVSPYFLALYLFDKQEFLSLGVWNDLLLSMAYSFPVLYMAITTLWLYSRIKEEEQNDIISLVYGACATSAHQLYGTLMFCLIFYGSNKDFHFYHYRNNSWIFSASFLLVFYIIYRIKKPKVK